MITNEFLNLPLVSAALRVVTLTEAIPLGYQFCVDLNKLLESEIDRFIPGGDFEFPAGIGKRELSVMPPMAFRTKNGIEIALQPSMIRAAWLDDDPAQPYPRYEALSDALKKTTAAVSDLLGGLPIGVVNMGYSNRLRVDRVHDDPTIYLAEQYRPIMPPFGARSVSYRNIARCEGGFDFRIELNELPRETPNEPPEYSFLTAAGSPIEDQGPFERLDQIHTVLNETFVTIISEEAKTEWQLQVN